MTTARRWMRTRWARGASNALLASGTVTTLALAPAVAGWIAGRHGSSGASPGWLGIASQIAGWSVGAMLWGGATLLLVGILLERRSWRPLWGSVAGSALALPPLLGLVLSASFATYGLVALVGALLVAAGFVLVRRVADGAVLRRAAPVGLLSLGFLGMVGFEALAGSTAL